MSPWLLLPVCLLVLYGLWLLLAQVFFCIEIYHAAKREERLALADRRCNGGELVEEKVS